MPSTRRGHLRRIGAIGCSLTTGVLGGCIRTELDDRTVRSVRVGSKPFPEQRILGNLAYERLRTVDGVRAINEIGYGNSRENWTATRTGAKDLYWEYTGTAWAQLPPRRDRRVTDPRELYELVAADARERGLRLAEPSQFSNGYVLVADRDWSERTGVTTISGLTAHIAAGHTDFDVAINEDFYHRRDAWDGITAYYGLEDRQRAAIEDGTFIVTSVGLTYELIGDGRVQVASGFATDPQLDRSSIVTLEDDHDYFLPYQPVPTAHAPTVDAIPDVLEALAPVVSALDGESMRRLNRQVVVEDKPPNAVAKSYLERQGERS